MKYVVFFCFLSLCLFQTMACSSTTPTPLGDGVSVDEQERVIVEERPEEEEEAAPTLWTTFKLNMKYPTSDQEVEMSAYAGKPLIVLHLSMDCSDCIDAAQRAGQGIPEAMMTHGKDVNVILFSMSTYDTVFDFLGYDIFESNYDWMEFIVIQNELSLSLGNAVVIDSDGSIAGEVYIKDYNHVDDFAEVVAGLLP